MLFDAAELSVAATDECVFVCPYIPLMLLRSFKLLLLPSHMLERLSHAINTWLLCLFSSYFVKYNSTGIITISAVMHTINATCKK
jgi:hypothetical protein